MQNNSKNNNAHNSKNGAGSPGETDESWSLDNHVPVQVAVISPAFVIKEMNTAFRNSFRRANIGDDFFSIYDEMLSSIKDHPLSLAKKYMRETRSAVKALINGQERIFDVLCLPTFDQHSRLATLIVVHHEPTEGSDGDDAINSTRNMLGIQNHSFDEVVKMQKQLVEINVELQRKNEALQQLTLSDSLTELFNRRAFDSTFERELRRAERYRHPLSLLFIDVDHFRDFNNTYDYDTGDAVLRNVARIAQEVVRDTDIVTRYGGEEFVVILPETGFNHARKVAERLRVMVETNKIKTRHGDLSVTVSIGTVTTYSAPIDGEKFMNLAVEALHEAKQTGRNRTVSYELTA